MSMHGRDLPQEQGGLRRAHHQRWFAAIFVLLAFVTVGCVNQAERLQVARDLFYSGQVDAAIAELEKERARSRNHRDAIALDLAMAQLFAGRPEQAEETLREVRDRFEHLEQTDATEPVQAMLTDDRAIAYSGEDYEKVLVYGMLAICDLMQNGGDTVAYCHQLNHKQEQIIQQGVLEGGENPKLAYRRVALGAYLHGALQEATHASYDEAERAYAAVASWEPEFAQAIYDLERARHGRHSPPGHGVAYVLAFVGRGPQKVEAIEEPTSAALLIADRILSIAGEYSLPPTIAPIKVPVISSTPSYVSAVRVQLGSEIVGDTQTITNVTQIAVQQHQAIYPYIMARAVARRAVKKAVVYAVKDELEVNPWVSLAFDAAGVAWEATEQADTRCWRLLPDQIQVLRIELPVGTHQLSLRPVVRGLRPGKTYTTEVPIEDGRSTFVLGYFPHEGHTGNILVSTPQ